MERRLACALATFAASCAAAGVRDEAGFVDLFDGESLTGWIYGTSGGVLVKSGRGYFVENGELRCTTSDGGNLFTESEYSDFVLRFEFKLSAGANNGIAIRAPLEGDAAYAGMEIQVLDDDAPAHRSLRPSQYHGSIYDVVAAERGALRAAGEWNEEEIRAEGPRIRVTVNGRVVVDADLTAVRDADVLLRHPGLTRASGHVGLLGHGSGVRFRRIRIARL